MSGTGKSEAAGYLARHFGLSSFYMGGVVLHEVGRLGLEDTPGNERKVREQLRRTKGMAAIARLALPRLRRLLKARRMVLVDGLYSAEELTFLRGFPRSSRWLLSHFIRTSTCATNALGGGP
jgi:dephospho-CoA kinase